MRHNFADTYQSDQKIKSHHPLDAFGMVPSEAPSEIRALAEALTCSAEGGYKKRTIYLDTSDLIEYAKHNNTVSGIQRVLANLIVNASEIAELHNVDLIFVFPDYDQNRIFSVHSGNMANLLAAFDDAGRSRVALEQAILKIYDSRKLVIPREGDIFTIAGAFWTYNHYELLLRLRQRGVGIVNFIHDLIQISHPEFVFEAATRQFRSALIDILASSTGLLTNSEYVAQDLRRFISERTDVNIPVRAVPLATELTPRVEDGTHVSSAIQEVMARPYVLSVSTIEVRKNHQFMVKVWERLIDEGVQNLPDLVFVGKVGWDIEPFFEYLEKADYLQGRVKILNHVSDGELVELYRGAQFTMYMSFVEGFGLPVAESLAYGIPCIASNRSSMPEVGGTLARYLDPLDIGSGTVLVRNLLENPAELTEWRNEIARDFRIRTWKQFAADYVAALLSFAEPDRRPYNNNFCAGELYGMGRWEIARRDAQVEKLSYLANTRDFGWHHNEDWGCWSAAREAGLTLATNLLEGDRATVYLLMKSPGRNQVVTLNVKVGNDVTALGTISGDDIWKTFECTVGTNGLITLTLSTDSPKPMIDDVRNLYFGIVGLAFRRSDDMEARLAILEALTFNSKRMSEPPPVPQRTFSKDTAVLDDDVDPEWYIKQYPDVQMVNVEPRDHYRWIGKRLGRKPNQSVALRDAAAGP